MDKSILNQFLHEYDVKRNIAIEKAKKRKVDLINANPKLLEIENKIAKNSLTISKSMLLADKKNQDILLSNLKKENSKLIKEKKALIKSITNSTTYFSPNFECKLCLDTGYVTKDGLSTLCSCLKQKIYDVYYNKSNIGNIEKENFSTFNEKIFSTTKNKEKYNSDLSPRENIIIIKDKTQSFINNFDDISEKNLIFTGTTGTGKTFLTNCIANELLKMNKTVLYQTAPVMFDKILNEKFQKDTLSSNFFENILTVDLLIIDDLGSENISDSKISDLFTIINTRLLNQNHRITKTIISTNLSIEDLFNLYTPRIGSRMAGNYRFLRFFGDDLRFKKDN